MSNFIDKLKEKIKELKESTLETVMYDISELYEWVDDEMGTDLEDILSDFGDEDIKDQLRDIVPQNMRIIELSDINAESDFDELMQDFKRKHMLTKIY